MTGNEMSRLPAFLGFRRYKDQNKDTFTMILQSRQDVNLQLVRMGKRYKTFINVLAFTK